MRQGGFTPPIIFGLDFVSWTFTKNFLTFLEVKIDIFQVNLKPWQAHLVLKKCLINEHFSCFHSSCQLGLSALGLFVKKTHYPYLTRVSNEQVCSLYLFFKESFHFILLTFVLLWNIKNLWKNFGVLIQS